MLVAGVAAAAAVCRAAADAGGAPHRAPLSFTHAYFEAVSGLTTTGSTAVSGLDALPVSVNVWRTFLQWLGGMGILILAVAVLPLLGVGGSQLFKAEAAGPVKDAKLTPRMTSTAKGLWGVYALFPWFAPGLLAGRHGAAGRGDAHVHHVSLGGLSPYDASFGHFQSPLLEAIAVVFMLVASCNLRCILWPFARVDWRGFGATRGCAPRWARSSWVAWSCRCCCGPNGCMSH